VSPFAPDRFGRWPAPVGALLLAALAASCESPAEPVPVNRIELVSTVPAPGGMILTGVPDPRTLSVTTGLTMTFLVTSETDRVARLVVFLEGSRNGVCLTNGAPIGVPPAPITEYRAGVPVEVRTTEFLLTSVCRYPSRVDLATARLMPASRSAPDQTPYYERQFALTYAIAE
jgi:hypothetical protein